MASLTPLSKGLLGLVVIGGMASAVWHLYLKDRIAGAPDAPTAINTPATPNTGAAPAVATTPPAPSPAETPVPLVVPAAQPSANPATPTAKMSADENFEAGRKFVAASDFVQARTHLELALQQGNAGAACLLGEMTLKGQGGIAANPDAAAKLFQIAQSRNTICFTAPQ